LEFVYVVKRYDLFDRRFPHGLELLGEAEMGQMLDRIGSRGFFVERRHAELDSTLKQIIPYCVVARGDEVFLMRRLSGGGEARLRGKRSIGVGGHVNPVDDLTPGAQNVLQAGMLRELEEEVTIHGPWSARAVGVLNDESTDVGSVHFGLVHVVEVEGDLRVRETHTLEGAFIAGAALTELCANERASFETWSALLVDRIGEVLMYRFV